MSIGVQNLHAETQVAAQLTLRVYLFVQDSTDFNDSPFDGATLRSCARADRAGQHEDYEGTASSRRVALIRGTSGQFPSSPIASANVSRLILACRTQSRRRASGDRGRRRDPRLPAALSPHSYFTALMATMIVLADMRAAPTAGLMTIPHG